MLKYSTYNSIYSNTEGNTKTMSETIHMIIKKNKQSLIRFIAVAAILLLSFTGFMTVFANAGEEVRYENVVVNSGDTLWGIGTAYKPQGMDIREYVDHIQRLNGLSSSNIQTGQLLKLPSFE